MKCNFLKHGLAIGYDNVAKPCCIWQYDSDYAATNQVNAVDLTTWHKSLESANKTLSQGIWPASCNRCRDAESKSDSFSVRLGGLNSYAHYQDDDITLEIRPGSVCNFACQTCWPEASSRVAMFHQQAGFIKSLPKNQEIADFDFLTGIAPRIRNVVLLGGEPFYDPACKNFLRWAQKNLQAQLTLFTNGSQIDWEFIDSYTGSMTIVFSLDAVGSPAEYIRFGTKWPVVENNYKKMLSRNGVETRVNVTTSIFNYLYLPALLQMLGQNRPKIITWGYASKPHFTAAAVADKSTIITSIDQALDLIPAMGLDTGQFHHANNALTGLKHNIQETPFQLEVSDKLRDFIRQMDRIKHINLRDHCPELASLLEIS